VKTFIVAEMSANHGGDLGKARALVEAAAHSGADAIKLQIWHPDRMVTNGHYKLEEGPWAGRTLHSLYQEASTPWRWYRELDLLAKNCGIKLFASVFDELALAFLESQECPIYKIASMEISDLGLLDAVARTGKPMFISLGAATEPEIERAVSTCKARSITPALLLCDSSYPASESNAALGRIREVREARKLLIGYSDHTPGGLASIIAVAMGATIIEKHICLDKGSCLDGEFSLEPDEFKDLVQGIRRVEAMRGTEAERASYAPLKRSLHWVREKKQGDVVELNDIITARPNQGMPPYEIDSLYGRTLAHDTGNGKPVLPDDFL
jgi:pseudaminic acid synthase